MAVDNRYDVYGFDDDGFDRRGYNVDSYDRNGYDHDGFDVEGFNAQGYDRYGFNRRGFDVDGFNRQGYSNDGYNRDGFDREGYNRKGFGANSYDKDGRDIHSFSREHYALSEAKENSQIEISSIHSKAFPNDVLQISLNNHSVINKTAIYVVPKAQYQLLRSLNEQSGNATCVNIQFTGGGKVVSIPCIRISGTNIYITTASNNRYTSFNHFWPVQLNYSEYCYATLSFPSIEDIQYCKIDKQSTIMPSPSPEDETEVGFSEIVKSSSKTSVVIHESARESAKVCLVTAKTYEAIGKYLPSSHYNYTTKNISIQNQQKSFKTLQGYFIETKNITIINAVEFVRNDGSLSLIQYTAFYNGNIHSKFKTDPVAELDVHNRSKFRDAIITEARISALKTSTTSNSNLTQKVDLPKKDFPLQKDLPHERHYESDNVWHSKVNLSELSANQKIMLYSQKCHCYKCAKKFSQDTIVDCTAYVSTKRGNVVPVTVQYCSGCSTFFMNHEVFESYNRKYGGLKFNCELDRSYISRGANIGFADDSFLSRAGYSVKASVSQRKRQVILAELLDSGQATKWEITEKISEFIKLRRGNPDMANAIACWEEDIAFVADYNAKNQPKAGRAAFKQGGKITR